MAEKGGDDTLCKPGPDVAALSAPGKGWDSILSTRGSHSSNFQWLSESAVGIHEARGQSALPLASAFTARHTWHLNILHVAGSNADVVGM